MVFKEKKFILGQISFVKRVTRYTWNEKTTKENDQITNKAFCTNFEICFMCFLSVQFSGNIFVAKNI